MKKFWIMLCCMALFISGCGEKQADQDYESGVKALENKEYDAAIVIKLYFMVSFIFSLLLAPKL